MAYDGFGLFGPDGFPVVPPWHPFFQQPRQLRIPQDPNEALKLIHGLREEGNTLFKEGRYSVAIVKYESALSICQAHGFEANAVKLHSNAAAVYLKLNDYEAAGDHAEQCIALDPEFVKGYYRRAEACKMQGLALQSVRQSRNATTVFQRAVQDYVECYKRSKPKDVDPLCQAVELAVDCKCTRQLKLPQLSIQPAELANLLRKLICKSDTKCEHLKFLLIYAPKVPGSGFASQVAVDLSDVSCSPLLDKSDLDAETLKAVLSLGTTIAPRDIEKAVCVLSESNLEVLKCSTSACRLQQTDVDSLCKIALAAKKLHFASHFISCGAKPNLAEVMKILNWKETDNCEGLFLYVAEQSKSKRSDFVVQAIKHNCYNLASMLLSAGAVACDQIDLGKLIASTSLPSNPEIFQQLLEAGISPNGTSNGTTTPLDAVLSLKRYATERKVPLIRSLVEKGANLEYVSTPRQEGTTIIHKLTEIALETGEVGVLEIVCSKFNFPENGRITNNRGQTPFHIAMRAKRNDTSESVCAVLSQFPINPEVADHSGKKPTDGKSKSDKRIQILQEAAERFKCSKSSAKPPKASKSKRKRPRKKAKEKESADPEPNPEEMEDQPDDMQGQPEDFDMNPTVKTLNGVSSADNPILASVKESLEVILSHQDDYFKAPPAKSLQEENQTRADERSKTEKPPCPPLQTSGTMKSSLSPRPANQAPKDHSEDLSDDELPNEGPLPDFDDLPWEVECPEKVVKFFKDKQTPRWLCQRAVEKIRLIAKGQWHDKLCKRVGSKPGLQLFEGRVTKSVRILWELAVQFSARCTNKLSCDPTSSKVIHVYSEVIRVWDIVLNHDRLHHCIRNVEKSHERGHQASVKIPLSQGMESASSSDERLPKMFLLGADMEETEALKSIAKKLQFVPAGSTKDDEYNVITFYSFSNAFARSMLEGENARRDFPFKEWPKEHDIINLPEGKESILLLGRSGTGKTTCCLYRLWNRFQTYWNMAQHAGPLISRNTLIFDQHQNDITSDSESELTKDSDENSDDSVESANPPTLHAQPIASNIIASSEAVSEHCSEPCPEATLPETLEHLHQVFITKNYVLCAQMRKRFYDMAASNDSAEEQMAFEDAEIANDLVMINDFAFPLFLTTRQFLLLLDNSLADGVSFFPRAEDGTLKVKILSSDYDHEDPDTLLDLEESESEDEGEFAEFEEYRFHQTTSKQQMSEWREVTASYFAEHIWPKISHACSDKTTDPLLVWMEIKSFIKGSREAVETQQGYLTQDEYEKLGKKMAPNFDGNRSEVYTLFLQYQHFLKRKRRLNLFDECDFVHDIYQRLSVLKDVPWSVHNFYVDEVQDFTQAELSVLLRCCRDPNGLFLTGDTAQSIMRGVSFRFGDLRTLFHEVQQKAKHVKGAVKIHVPQLQQLTINFRSHSGVLQLAASIIDLLKEFFPNSFDCLPGDEGMFPGPIPTVLQSCNVSDLALLMRSNKREASSIEFGAHQVIIVQSEDSKKALPDVLKAGIVLTVFEAKGLEFDDVLLYNFFCDSKISKEWRVVTSFVEHKPSMVENSVPAFESQPRPLDFDGRQHKSLNPELKYLYTAITRAKCNLWIYDSDEDKRLPVFDYWCKRNLVKVIKVNDVSEEDQTTLFAATSTPEEWKEQGDYFKKKRLWEPAMKCYQKSGIVALEMEAKAYFMAQQAHGQKAKEMHQLYLQAALAFLQCDQLQHDVKYLANAAKCLKNAKQHSAAAKLFERLGQYEQALKGFIRSKDVTGCAKLKEKSGDYTGAIKLFITFNRRIDALAQASEYERKGIILHQEVRVAHLAHTFAKMYSKHKDKTKLLKVLEYMPDASQRIRFLKEAKLFSKACEVHIQQGQYAEAYQLLTAQAKYKDGIDLAEKQGDEEMAARFTVQKAVAELVTNGSVKDPDIMNRLQIIAGGPDSSQSKAQACLLLGRSNKDASMCRKAFDLYKSFTPACKIGQVESFSAFTKLKPQADRPLQLIRPMIEACKEAKSIQNAIENRQNPTASSTRILQEVEDFYYLQKQGDVYSFPQSLDLWGKLVEYSTASNEVDPDGMVRLDVTLTLKRISEQLSNYISEWMEKDCMNVNQALKSRLAGFPFHKHLCEGGYLQQSFTTYPPSELKTYINLCLLSLEADSCGSKLFRSMDVTRILRNLFSPQAAVYLPVSKLHMYAIRSSELLTKMFEKETAATLGTRDVDFRMNQWLETWRICCLLGKGTQRIESVLNERQRQENIKAKSGNQAIYKPSHTSVYSSREKKHQHVFSLFLKSCALIRSDSKVLTASKIVLHFVVRTIAKSLASTISVTNFVNIVCIHSIALLGLATHSCFLLKQPCTFIVPHTYSRIVQVFNDLNCQTADDKWLLRACMEDVNIQKCPKSNLPKLTKDILELLQLVLDVLLGRHNRHFYVLRFAIRNWNCLQNGEVKHCLILVLTLFGNLAFAGSFWSDEQLHHYQREINAALQQLPEQLPEQHPLKQVQKIFASSANVSGTFLALSQLLATADRSSHLQRFTVVQKQQKVPKLELTQFRLQRRPQRPMIPIYQQLHHPIAVQPQSPSTASPQSLQASSQIATEVSALPGVLQKLFPGDPLQPQSGSPSLASPQQSQPVSDTLQTSFPQAVQDSFDWGQFPVAQAHPLTAHSLDSHEIQADLTLHQQNQPEIQSSTPNVLLGMTSAPVTATAELPEIQQSMSYPEPEEEEQEEKYEHGPDIQDEDIWEAFEESQELIKSPTTESTIIGISVTKDYSMIDENFCRFCGVPLRQSNVALIPTVESWEEDEVAPDVVEREGESVESTVVNNSIETYLDHIESGHHKLQERLYTEFSKEVTDWQYRELSIELKKILDECESFEEHDVDLEMDSVMTTIKVLLEKNEKEIEDIRRSCEWKAGLWQVQNVIVGQMESLVHRGRKEQRRVQEKIQRMQKEKMDNAPQPETLLEEEDTYDLPEEIEQATPMDVEGEKTRKRIKKKDRKRKK